MSPFESTAIICSPKNWPPFCTHAAQRAQHLAILAVEEPDVVVREIGNNRNRCALSGENITPPAEPPSAVYGASTISFTNLPCFVVTMMRLAARSAA